MLQMFNWLELNVTLAIIVLGVVQVLFIGIIVFLFIRLAKGLRP